MKEHPDSSLRERFRAHPHDAGGWGLPVKSKALRLTRVLSVMILAAGLIGAAALLVPDLLCRSHARGRVYESIGTVPSQDVGLVLGTAKLTRGGWLNLHFQRRIEAAAELYHAGKVRHLLVSGDNHVVGYDEPTDMMEALVHAGVPESSITRDYAGFRTLDSVVRANRVFGLKSCTIITEKFHCNRALWIARVHGIDAVAYAAPDLESLRWSARVKAREVLARTKCALDLYVLNRKPRFSGPREPIILAGDEAGFTGR